MSTTDAIKWKEVDHLADPVSLAVARVSTGQKSFTDDEVVAVVNAAPVSAIGGLVLPLTRQNLNDTFGPRRASRYTPHTAIGVYRRSHDIGNEIRCEYYIVGEGDVRREIAARECTSREPAYFAKSSRILFDVSPEPEQLVPAQQTPPPKTKKRSTASRHQGAKSGATPDAKRGTQQDKDVIIKQLRATITELREQLAASKVRSEI